MLHTCWISKSSALLITQSTFQQQQRNRGKLHKHTICISLHLKQTKDDRNTTQNSFKIDYHTSLSQEMFKISKTSLIIRAKV